MRKKILFYLNNMGMGGAERVVCVLSGFFAADGYEVMVATLWYSEREYVLDSRVRRIHAGLTQEDEGKSGIYKAIKRAVILRQLIRAEKPDIVISFCNKANFRSAYAMAGMKTPLLVSVRNDPKIDYQPYALATAWMERKASGCVFQTPDARAFFHKRLQEKSRIIWNPVDQKYLSDGAMTDISAIAGTEISTVPDMSRENFVITVGRISAQKNHLLLIRAFEKIKEEFPNLTLRIYGGVDEEAAKEKLISYIDAHQLEERVFLMGVCDRMEQEIRKATLFVLPSDYEGMPNALMEAMVTGLPVIATDCPCGGSRMLIENEKNGLLVPMGDQDQLAEAMRRLLQDRKLADVLGTEAKKLADQVRPEVIYAAWKDYVEELLAEV